MKPFSIDKKTYQILDYIYEHSECTVSSLCKFSCISSIEQSPPLIAALMNLFDNRYISVCNPRLPLSASYSLEAYNDACCQHQVALFSSDCIVAILPDGSFYVEEHRTKEQNDKMLRSLANSAKRHAQSAETASSAAIKIAKTASDHADAAKTQATAATDQVCIPEEQLRFARKQADSASKDALASKHISIIAIIVSMASVIVAILQLFQ